MRDMAEQVQINQDAENERRGILGGPTDDMRKHRILVEMTDPAKVEAAKCVTAYIYETHEALFLRDFFRVATPAEMLHVETLLGFVKPASDARETLKAVAKGFTEINVLQADQRHTAAEMIRLCLVQLKSNQPAKRNEAMASLTTLAEMLEK